MPAMEYTICVWGVLYWDKLLPLLKKVNLLKAKKKSTACVGPNVLYIIEKVCLEGLSSTTLNSPTPVTMSVSAQHNFLTQAIIALPTTRVYFEHHHAGSRASRCGGRCPVSRVGYQEAMWDD